MKRAEVAITTTTLIPIFPAINSQPNNHCFQIRHGTDEVPYLTISPRTIDLNAADPPSSAINSQLHADFHAH